MSSSTKTMTGPTPLPLPLSSPSPLSLPQPLRSAQWSHHPSTTLNHLRPSQIPNFRHAPVHRASTLIKPQPYPLKVSTNNLNVSATRSTLQPRLAATEAGRRHDPRVPNVSTKSQSITTTGPATGVTGMTTGTTTTISNAPLSQTIETAFKVFNDRFQKDLREFQTVCTRFVIKEMQEKDRWHRLYLEVVKERDEARMSRGYKRTREECDHDSHSPSPQSASPPSPSPLYASQPSPRSASPPPLSGSPGPTPITTTTTSTTVERIPSISHSPTSSPSPVSSSSPSLTPASSSSSSTSSLNPSSSSLPERHPSPPVTNHMIMRFYDFGAAQNIDSFAGVVEDDALPEPKRRKSLDLGEPSPRRGEMKRSRTQSPRVRGTAVGGRTSPVTQHAKVEVKKEEEPHPMPMPKPMSSQAFHATFIAEEFEHVDIMYIRRGDTLVCRACSLKSKPQPSSQPTSAMSEPTSFSVLTPWDDLKRHCVVEHPEECGEVARLHPAEIFELRRRIYGS
ncbi:hypothetical protein CVT24_005277 [Panaeolus cyanescens]|uniref:Uncharacterized protein n=1 Tax=Panaeolus cyanescens TaxID=181874 RepID=A0A409Y8T5_9AGAR|nr:hypothetical protein CVT24_005277 [Panaeolus cyanescens]